MLASILILALVTTQRVGELLLASRNARRLLDRGGQEYGAEHYPLILGLHAAWLVGLWALAWDRPVSLWWLGAYVALQALRVWILAILGERWTTRIILAPGDAPPRRGPYRCMSHPNYFVIAAEVAVLPLVFGLASYAAVFFLLNASVLWVRIRVEERAKQGAL